MGHYAKVLDDNVIQVISAKEDFFEEFIDNSPGEWIKTSYNTRHGVHYQVTDDGIQDYSTPSKDQSKALRMNFAGVGYTYNRQLDAFIPPKPYDSWLLDESICDWYPPVEKPNDGNRYSWNEQDQTWDLEDGN